MDINNVLGRDSYYYNPKYPVDKMLKILNQAIQYDEDGIILLDDKKVCVYASKHAFGMFYCPEELDLLQKEFFGWMRELGIEENAATFCRVFKKNDKERLYKVRHRCLFEENGKTVGYSYVIQNLSDALENDMGEHYRLTHDELTHLYNKEGFSNAVTNLLKNSGDKEYILVYSNIKDFKLINQLFGLEKGNDILITIGEMLGQKVRDDDVYGRINGDHFALCMPKERFDEKEFKIAVKELATRITSNSYTIHLQIGVYDIKEKNMDVSLMCDRAYMACKSIKRDNICEVAWYSDEMLVNALLEKEILSSFDFAIINRQFGIYLQPQVYADGTIYGAEALARWIHPENGIIQPGVFISVLEKADLIYKLDKYIWELAAKQLSDWKGTPRENIAISVNVSPKDIYYLNIDKVFVDLVKKYDIRPEQLNIEITETAVTSDVSKCAKLILELQSKGFLVEIDDFGSGYSSLNMLKDINANVLKIDMGFLRKTENQKRAMVILNYTIDMAHELGMKVVTEGVEKKEQLDYLIDMGCEMFQGFYFDKPMPIEEFERKY